MSKIKKAKISIFNSYSKLYSIGTIRTPYLILKINWNHFNSYLEDEISNSEKDTEDSEDIHEF